MRYCTRCGTQVEHLTSGGCGGNGSMSGCPKCNVVFEQTSGGIVATPGGESYQVNYFSTFEEMKLQLLEDAKPREVTWGDDKGKWRWSEGYYGETHVYEADQREQAEADHAAFVRAFEDSMSTPVCCGRKAKATNHMNRYFKCRVCKGRVAPLEEDATT